LQKCEEQIHDAKQIATSFHKECERFETMVELTEKLSVAYKSLKKKKVSHPNLTP
jgi:hypothetical protein